MKTSLPLIRAVSVAYSAASKAENAYRELTFGDDETAKIPDYFYSLDEEVMNLLLTDVLGQLSAEQIRISVSEDLSDVFHAVFHSVFTDTYGKL